VDFKFKKLDLHWTSAVPECARSRRKGIGAFFEGTKGTLVCDYSSREIRIDGQVLSDILKSQNPYPITRSSTKTSSIRLSPVQQPESKLDYARQIDTSDAFGNRFSYKLQNR